MTPKIKPLVWEQLGRSYRAAAPLFGSIRVENYYSDRWSIYWSAPGITDLFTAGEHPTPELAQAAAQADYAARMLAALDPAWLARIAALEAQVKAADGLEIRALTASGMLRRRGVIPTGLDAALATYRAAKEASHE